MRSSQWNVAVTLMLTLCATLHARAEFVEKLDEVLGKVLTDPAIHDKAGPVIVARFQPNPQQDLHADAAIQQHVLECLKRRNVNVARSGEFPAISGRYGFVATDHAQIDIEFDVTDRSRQKTKMYPARVQFGDDASEVISIAAPSTVKLTPKASGFDRGQQLISAVKQPQVAIEDTWVGAPGGQFAVAMAFKKGTTFQPAKVTNANGFAYVQVKLGQQYRILVKNNSSNEAVATVSVDGLDIFHYADAKSPGYLVPAGGVQEIKGWFISTRVADSFVIGKFADTPAKEILGDAADAGVICVQFANAWIPGSRPKDEPSTLGGGEIGTKRGPPVNQDVQRVTRQIGGVREAICIRYGVQAP